MSEVAPGFSFDVPAYGSEDPEVPQLDAAQVIDLKDKLRDEDIASSVAAEIAISSCFDPSSWDSRPEYQELLRNPKVQELLGDAAYMAADWTQGIHDALQLPAEEWPKGMTPPGVFSEALKRTLNKEAQDA